MTTNLPPLAEALSELAKRQNPYHTAPLAEALVDLAEDLAPRYDERIAALEAEVERLKASLRRMEMFDKIAERATQWGSRRNQSLFDAAEIVSAIASVPRPKEPTT